jgi:hypothetical protein
MRIPVLQNLTWGKFFLPRDADPMAAPSWRLGVYLWSSHYIRWRWDRFSTRVHVVRCAWAPVATSHHGKCLGPLLPEALGLTMLIHCGKPSGMFDRGPGSCPGSMREVGWADR